MPLGHRILFLHHNFPAQFRKLASHLAAKGEEVLFLSERNFVGLLPGIEQRTVPSPKDFEITSLGGQVACAQRFRQSLLELKIEGWIPDRIVSHSGWGCGLDAGWVFPDAKRISYLEWWFADDAMDFEFDPNNPWFSYSKKSRLNMRHRNMSIALELLEADAVVSPTQWQKKHLPGPLRERCQVIHEGVDINFFGFNPSWRPIKKLRLTYATRGLEPMRSFPEFVLALPELLRLWPNLEVLIAGDDRMAYGGIKPEEGSYGKWAKAVLSDWCEEGRVKFLGHLPKLQYARLLKSSHVHCYLTRPFVASWSLLDAMASGCCLVASDLELVKEFADAKATFWTDQRDQNVLQQSLNAALALDSAERKSRGIAQRHLAETYWDQSKSLDKWVGLLEI